MGKIVEKKKKKKGRPSLLDLQKRNLRLQKHQPEEQKPNPNPNPYSNPNFRNPIVPNPNPNPNRRFTRRNRNPDGITEENERVDAGEDDDDDEDDDDSSGKRREKKLKLVLRLPSQQQNQRSSLNSSYLNSGSYVSDSNAEDENGETPLKKRKINAVGDGSGHGDGEKGEKSNSASKATETHLGKSLESGPTTPLPDKKLLVFILDRLQKKDSYGVFSEPVDPKELPDYHEIVEHPMDFGTVRKKLSGGAYASLEQFEKDVFLICSNAMQYNASDTIYFRQARSIQELAKKNFENLRQDSDDNEPEPKIVRRGRPPTKNLKKPMGKDSAGSEFSTDAMLATRGDNAMWSNSYDLRKGPLSDKYGSAGVLGRTSYGSRNSESYTGWSAEHKSERNGEFSGSTLRGLSTKYGKKQFVLDENRRDTYKHYHPSVGGREPSVLTTFDGEKKQLMAVGLHTEHGYARSLARFAANLGPVAWKMASKKIERVLPAGVNFGPGWVGENEAPPPQPLLMSSPPRPSPPQQPCTSSRILPSATTPIMVESKGERLSNKQELLNNLASDGLPIRSLPSTTIVSSSVVANTLPEPTTECVGTARGLSNESGFGLVNSSSGIRPPFQIHQNPALHPSMNGFNSGFGFNLASQMGKLVRPVWPAGSTEASMHSQMLNMVSRSNNFVHLMPTNRLESENPKVSVCSGKINSENSLQNSSHEAQPRTKMGLRPQPSWHGLSMQQKQDSGPPDLNVRFQSPGSPSSSTRVDSTQPDLALQL